MIFASVVCVPLVLFFIAVAVVQAVPCLIWGGTLGRVPRAVLGTAMAAAGLYVVF
jgi:hypothetical protein